MVKARDRTASGRLRIGMVGGGQGAFIGAVHRMAMRLDDGFELVAGALSADPQRARESAATAGIAPDRAYADWREMARAEAARPDGIEATIVVTPNHLHAPVATAFLEAGIDVICDKPLALTLAEGQALVRLAEDRGRVLAVTLNTTGNAMIRQARAMVAAGALGPLRSVSVDYLQDWLSRPIDAQGNKQAEWRTDPARAGASAVLADIGVHAHSLAAYVGGLPLEAVLADLTTSVPGRRLDDHAHVLLRYAGGVRGVLTASQVTPGHLNDLSLRVSGAEASLEWSSDQPEVLWLRPLDAPAQCIARGGPGTLPQAEAVSRLPGGHPEGFIEAFANLYRDAAALIRAHRAGRAPDPDLSARLPQGCDGLEGLRFVDAAVRSAQAGGVWTPLP